MTNERTRQLMQEALDEALDAESNQELSTLLETNPDEAQAFDRLKQVDELLANAGMRHTRAPERLAVTIMARLAEAVKSEEEIEEFPEITEAMIQTAMQMVMAATMPLLIGAGWILLNAQSRPHVLEGVLYRVTTMFILVIDVMKVIIEEAEKAYDDDPQLAVAILSLIPAAMLILMGELLEDDDEA